jgi:uncharacterized membrane protein
MDREIVLVVPTEAASYGVVKALRALDDEGTIELYSATVLSKRADGTVSVQDPQDRTPLGTVLGISMGALIGLLAGPGGMLAGAAVGGTAGFVGDLAYSGFAGDFVRDVSDRLKPGMHAVCASVWEDWTVPIDVAVSPFGAVVLRQATDDVAVAQIRADMQALKEEAAHIKSEISKAQGDVKTQFEAKREELRLKQAAQRERLQKRAQALQERWEAQLASIQQKTTTAKAEAKVRHQHHIDQLDRFAAMQKESFKQLFA